MPAFSSSLSERWRLRRRGLKPINLTDPHLVPLRPRDRAEAARLLAVLIREAGLNSAQKNGPPDDEGGIATDLPIAPSSNGKRRRRKGAGEAA